MNGLFHYLSGHNLDPDQKEAESADAYLPQQHGAEFSLEYTTQRLLIA